MKLFKASNNEAEAVSVLRARVVEKQPFRVLIKGATEKTPDDTHDLSVLATASVDPYLMSISGGEDKSKYFGWDKESEFGVDCARRVDSLLALAAVVSISPGCICDLCDVAGHRPKALGTEGEGSG